MKMNRSIVSKPRRPWIWVWAAVGFSFLGVLFCVAQPTAERIAAHKSMTNISYVGSVLLVEKPDIFDEEAVLRALEKNNNDGSALVDGWGNPLVLYESNTDPPSYLVMSFGRDGIRGDCCEKFVDNLDSDLVWRDGDWLQVYNNE